MARDAKLSANLFAEIIKNQIYKEKNQDIIQEWEVNLDPAPLKKILNYSLEWNLEKGLEKTIPYYENEFKKSK